MSPPDTTPPALSFRDVSVVRGGRPIWSEGTFEVPAGGIIAVIGANGAGKTTLLQVALGSLPVASGTVRVFGHRPGRRNDVIGYVPQHYDAGAGEAIRVRDAVLLGLTGHRWGFAVTSAAARRRVDEALQWVAAADLSRRRLAELSGGQRQRVAIAAALVSEPQLLLLDEPLASLDLRNQHDIVSLLARLNAELKVTVAVVAHDLNPLLAVLTSAIYLLDGHPHHAPIDRVVEPELLTHLYGTDIAVAHTLQGQLYMRGA